MSTAEPAAVLSYLDQFKLVQGALAFAIIATTLFTGWRGFRNSQRPDRVGSGTEVYFDGPVTKVMMELRRIADSGDRVVEAIPAAATLRTEFDEKLRLTRKDMYDNMRAIELSLKSSTHDIENRVRAVELDFAEMRGASNRRRPQG